MANNNKKAIVAKKAKANKPATKIATVKKVIAPKKSVAKKAEVKKPTLNKKVQKSAKKASSIKKEAVESKKNQKIAIPIKKHSPVKKAAKTGAKKAVIIKLATPKKTSGSKTSAETKKVVATKPVKQKPTEKSSAKSTTVSKDHKAELKKAIAKVKAKQKEETKKPAKPFIMPKTNTEKARKYEPEFTKSVLDQSPVENSGPTMRYSDNELVEFRELITRKLETAKKELGYLQGLITRKDQMGGDESDNRYMTMEDGSLSMEREQLSQMASRQITFIDHLEKAMMRIENKTYGICRVTGKLIDKARLRAVPHATLSIEAKMGIAR
ncbi:MAG: TraR/DksA C4-type zinc finger protein [Ginsengibacter sp.]